MRGPAAPKDPTAKRPCMYITLDKIVSGTREDNNEIKDEFFLEGRLVDQARFVCEKIDNQILELLADVPSIRKLVHSIGVIIQAEQPEHENDIVDFQVQCYGKTQKYSAGTLMNIQCVGNGCEEIITLSDYPENEEDLIFGQFNLRFPAENENYRLTVKFYLNDGYEVPELEVDPPVQFDTPDYQAMIADSLEIGRAHV